MNILLSLIPYIIFDYLPKDTYKSAVFSLLFTLLITILANRNSLKKYFILPWATAVFFVVVTIVVAVFKNNWVLSHIWTLTNSMLSLIAWGSLLAKKPFTMQYAKKVTPKKDWNHPVFIFINNVLTASWGIIFLLHLFLYIAKNSFLSYPSWLNYILINGTTILGIIICNWFPRWYPHFLKNKIGESNESISN